MMRDHLYRRLAAGMTAGPLTRAAPSAWAARTAAAVGTMAAGQPGNSAGLAEIPGGRHLHLECHGTGGPTLPPDGHRIAKRLYRTISNTQPGHTGLGSQTGA
jgi:hypothetical protein